MKTKVPAYSFFRILIVSMILYFLLMNPINVYIMAKNFPTFLDKSSLIQNDTTSIKNRSDSINTIITLNAPQHDINITTSGNKQVSMDLKDDKTDISSFYFNLTGFILMLVIIGINIPFKVFIKRRRKNKEISPKLKSFCQKYLFRMPYLNSGVLLFALIITKISSVINYASSDSKTEHDMGINILIILIISSLLATLFTFFWQQHSIHFKNLEYFFDKEELYKRQKNLLGKRMRGKLLLVHGITTLLPVSIIVFYIFMSISRPADFGVNKISKEQSDILLGGYSSIVHDMVKDEASINDIASFYYINTIDMFFSSIGIIAGVIVTLIYVIFFIRWLTFEITSPVKNLLIKMEEAIVTKEYSYSLVRSGDELGQLTEGYNVMAEKIMNYIREVEEINRGLEEKVKERTTEIAAQRDEIEAQRDEIEAQRDLVTAQKMNIEVIHKEVTDSINYATRLQTAILPNHEILKNIISEHFVLFKPKDNLLVGFC
jgi:methyl-accepting chemotaxis protein